MSSLLTTRRDVLRKVGLTASLVAIPGVAGAVVANRAEAAVCAAPAVSEIEALALRWRELVEAWTVADADYEKRSAAYDAAKPKRPKAAYANRFFIRHCGGYRHWFAEPIPAPQGSKMRYRSFGNADRWETAARMLSAQGSSMAKATADAKKRASIMRAHEAAVAKVDAETGFQRSYETAAAICAEMSDVEARILSLPATSGRDLSVKAAVLNRQLAAMEAEGTPELVSFVSEVARFNGAT